MSISIFERNATIAEMAVEMDRRGAAIERLEAQLAAAEAKAARLETALRRAIALAEVMLTNDPNETISDAGHTLLEWWMAELENLRAALEAKP